MGNLEKQKRREKIAKLMSEAVINDLAGCDFLYSFDEEYILAEYNGIGPEFLPAGVREKVTKYLALFEPAALIHDMRNAVSDGSRKSFNFANIEFHENCRKMADRRYPWWHLRRYLARAAAAFLYDFVCSQAGWRAWMECHEKLEIRN